VWGVIPISADFAKALGIWWLALNILMLLVGLITITIGANRFVQPASALSVSLGFIPILVTPK